MSVIEVGPIKTIKQKVYESLYAEAVKQKEFSGTFAEFLIYLKGGVSAAELEEMVKKAAAEILGQGGSGQGGSGQGGDVSDSATEDILKILEG